MDQFLQKVWPVAGEPGRAVGPGLMSRKTCGGLPLLSPQKKSKKEATESTELPAFCNHTAVETANRWIVIGVAAVSPIGCGQMANINL